MTRKIPEDTPRVLFVALGAWAIAAVVGAMEGVFAKLSLAEMAGLAAFAFAFAAATTYLDESLRKYLAAARTRSYLKFVVEIDLAMAIGTMLALGLAKGDAAAALTRFPLAVVLVFALPVAAVGHLLLAERLLRRRSARPGVAALSR